jgi:hypothetical protein
MMGAITGESLSAIFCCSGARSEELNSSEADPIEKNDTFYVEQKNFNIIRQTVGYARFENEGGIQLLTELYRRLRLLVNHFYPSGEVD